MVRLLGNRGLLNLAVVQILNREVQTEAVPRHVPAGQTADRRQIVARDHLTDLHLFALILQRSPPARDPRRLAALPHLGDSFPNPIRMAAKVGYHPQDGACHLQARVPLEIPVGPRPEDLPGAHRLAFPDR